MIDRSFVRSIVRSLIHSFIRSIDRSIVRSLNFSFDRSIDRSFDCAFSCVVLLDVVVLRSVKTELSCNGSIQQNFERIPFATVTMTLKIIITVTILVLKVLILISIMVLLLIRTKNKQQWDRELSTLFCRKPFSNTAAGRQAGSVFKVNVRGRTCFAANPSAIQLRADKQGLPTTLHSTQLFPVTNARGRICFGANPSAIQLRADKQVFPIQAMALYGQGEESNMH